jgi:hypothetical protein
MGAADNIEAPGGLRQRTAALQPTETSKTSALEERRDAEEAPPKEKKTMGKTPSGEGKQLASQSDGPLNII